MAKIDKTSNFKKLYYGIKWFFLSQPEGFSDKPTIRWKRIAILSVVLVITFITLVLLMAEEPPKVTNFSEKKDGGTESAPAPNNSKAVGKFSNGFGGDSGSEMSSQQGSPPNRNTPMILARAGDISTQLPPGTKFSITLSDNATITSQNQPLIGIVDKDVVTDFGIALPKGSRVFGDASFDKEFKRANVQWKSVMFSDGRSKNMSAIALAEDNQPGIDGDVHSDSVKNTFGSLITHFIAGAAEGSIARGPTGQSQGGLENGLLNGASETAHERADSWAENLKKERAWIELKKGTHCQAILLDGFTYREPGGLN